jgi:hypothetical protein
MEIIVNIKNYVNDNQIPGDLTIYSDAQGAILHVGHAGREPRQDCTIRAMEAVQHRNEGGWQTRTE